MDHMYEDHTVFVKAYLRYYVRIAERDNLKFVVSNLQLIHVFLCDFSLLCELLPGNCEMWR